MERVVVYGRDLKLQGSVLTQFWYRKEFGTDLYKTILEACQQTPLDAGLLLTVVWAMAKTYDEETSDYQTWLGEFNPKHYSVTDMDWLGEVDGVICAELFRRKPSLSRKAIEGIKRFLARVLGAMAKRLSA